MPSAEAEAGWRELGLVVVSMHEGDDAEARKCYTALRKELVGRNEGEIVHSRLARDAIARKLDDATMTSWTKAAKSAFAPLHDWEPSVWRGADGKTVGSGYTVDAWILIDCAPSEQRLDVVSVAPVTGSVMRLHIQGQAVDADLRELVTTFAHQHAWADWEP